MKFSPERTFLDHFLAFTGGSMALFALGISVGKPTLAAFMAVVSASTGMGGYFLSRLLERSRIHTWDGWLFAIAAFASVLFVRQVNASLPEQGFPFALLAAVMMFSIVSAGGVFAWRDGTLLFLSLPSIALFGLVGTIDSWRPGVALFCIFIVLIAVLYARTYQRTMMRRVEAQGADVRLLRRGAWRWMAGPEWAFLAAGVTILVSFAGAPVIQVSLQGVSDQVKVNVQNQIRPSSANPSSSRITADSRIGGPPPNLTDAQVFKVKTEEPLYLRTGVFTRYNARGWSSATGIGSQVDFRLTGKVLPFARDPNLSYADTPPKVRPVRVELMFSLPHSGAIPSPGLIYETDVNADFMEPRTGLMYLQSAEARRIGYVALVPATTFPDTIVGRARSPVFEGTDAPPALVEIADRLVGEATSPGDIARNLERGIGSICKYNTKTPAVPGNVDPVVYFLTEKREGYCDLFASAFIRLAAIKGLPCRYVTGYLVDQVSPDSDGFTKVAENNAHAWAEVYFEDYGWIAFDATGYAEDVTPDTNPNGFNVFMAMVSRYIGDNATWILPLVAFVIGVVAFARASQNRVAKATFGLRRPLVHLHNDFQKSVEKAVGHPKRFSQTLTEFVFKVAPDLGAHGDEALDISKLLQQSLFRREEPEAEEIGSLKSRVSAFSKALKSTRKAKA